MSWLMASSAMLPRVKANVLPVAGPPPLQPSTVVLTAPSASDPTFAIPPA